MNNLEPTTYSPILIMKLFAPLVSTYNDGMMATVSELSYIWTSSPGQSYRLFCW